jgi:hypothetical protein
LKTRVTYGPGRASINKRIGAGLLSALALPDNPASVRSI